VLRRMGQLPRYEVHGTGPDHARRYRARLFVAGDDLGSGEGRSKKDAEQAAARVALEVLTASAPAAGEPPDDACGAVAGEAADRGVAGA